MDASGTVYPLTAARALALHAQALAAPLAPEPPQAMPDAGAVSELVARIGCVQIDTLHVVQRSHYLVLWSRLGHYDTAELDRLVYGDPRAPGENCRLFFEDWLHAACILPLAEYRYRLPLKRRLRERSAMSGHHALAEPHGADYQRAVLERVRQEGGLRAADFQYEGPRRGSWWDWKPAKSALENLFAWGDLMIARRVNFQRVYDLPERVLPAWVDTREPTRDETVRHMVLEAVRTFGVCLPAQVRDYDYFVKLTEARPAIEQLLAEGVLQPLVVQLASGERTPMLIRAADRPLLDRAAQGGLAAVRTTFLSPFDNLFWPANRDRQFWGVTQRLEAYKPQDQRQYGYFSLTILHKDRMVGRFDPKFERARDVMRLKALYLEPGVSPDAELVAGVAAAMRSFLAQHAAHDLVIEHSEPAEFGARLAAAL